MARRRNAGLKVLPLWIDTLLAGVATATTLSVRLPQLATGTMSAAERRRMVAEKAAAVHEGAMAGGVALLKVASRRRRPSPLTVLNDVVTLVDAVGRPARRTVRRNARRLTKRKT